LIALRTNATTTVVGRRDRTPRRNEFPPSWRPHCYLPLHSDLWLCFPSLEAITLSKCDRYYRFMVAGGGHWNRGKRLNFWCTGWRTDCRIGACCSHIHTGGASRHLASGLMHASVEAQKCWDMVGRVLVRDGASTKAGEMFYKAIIQQVLLFGSKTWNITSRMLKPMCGFHCMAARLIISRMPYKEGDRWV